MQVGGIAKRLYTPSTNAWQVNGGDGTMVMRPWFLKIDYNGTRKIHVDSQERPGQLTLRPGTWVRDVHAQGRPGNQRCFQASGPPN